LKKLSWYLFLQKIEYFHFYALVYLSIGYFSFYVCYISGAPPTGVGGTNALSSAKPAEAHPPALIILALNAAIRRIANIASVDTLSAFIRQLELAAFCEGG
jgi:hypothetical protein